MDPQIITKANQNAEQAIAEDLLDLGYTFFNPNNPPQKSQWSNAFCEKVYFTAYEVKNFPLLDEMIENQVGPSNFSRC